jgi:hypothetical protein
MFLKSIRRLAPEVLSALRDELLPVIDPSVDRSTVRYAVMKFISDMPHSPDCPEGYDQVLQSVVRPIWEWAQRWRLAFADAGLTITRTVGYSTARVEARFYHLNFVLLIYATLQDWQSSEDHLKNLDWPRDWLTKPAAGSPKSQELGLDIEEFLNWLDQGLKGAPDPVRTHDCYHFDFRVPKWNCVCESRATAKKRILDECKRRVNAKLDLEASFMARFGAKHRAFRPEHFDWLTLYQVKGRSYNQIAVEYGSDRPTITDAVQKAACALIGPCWEMWIRKPGRAGRPRGS